MLLPLPALGCPTSNTSTVTDGRGYLYVWLMARQALCCTGRLDRLAPQNSGDAHSNPCREAALRNSISARSGPLPVGYPVHSSIGDGTATSSKALAAW